MSIAIIHKREGMTASDMRSTLTSESVKREELQVFIDNKVIDILERQDLISNLTKKAAADNRFQIAPNTKDFLEQWEKKYAVTELKSAGFTVDAMDTSKRYPVVKEWDLLVMSFKPTVSQDEIDKARNIAIDVLRDPKSTAALDDNLQVIPSIGVNGTRAVIASQMHDNTGNQHVHMWVNRFAVDLQNKEVSKGIDFSNAGVVTTVMNTIEARMKEAGINHPVTTVSSTGKAVTNNGHQLNAQDNGAQELSKAGGQLADMTTAQVGVAVPDGQGHVTVVAAPLNPDAIGMQQQSVAMKNEMERLLRKIEEDKARVTALAEGSSKLDQAVYVMAQNEVLTSKLTEAQAKLEEATAKGDNLEATNTDLSEKLDAAQEAHQMQHQALVGIGVELSEKAGVLGIDPVQAEDLARGNLDAIGTIVENLGEQVGAWNEALDQLPEEVAEALREDPFKGLNDLMDELLEKRELTTKLTTERDGLEGQLTAANTLNTQLQDQVDAKAADLMDLQAKMAKREEEFAAAMNEQVEKVREAEAAVLRSEGTLQAKQEQLDAEQAKVKELARTKDAIMSVMTSDDPHATWEQTKDLFKDDIFANRAMGAFLHTSDKLEKAQQNITTMQAELVDLGQVKLDLEAAKATIEENLVVVNDAGVADLRTLATEYKKTLAANSTLEQQIADLTAAAQVDQATAEKTKKELEAARQEATQAKQEVTTVQQSAEALQAEQAKATAEVERLKAELEQALAKPAAAVAPEVQQLADYLAANPNMAKALAVIQSDPEWAALVEEASDNTELRTVMLDITGPSQGLQQADYTQGGITPGPDYTQELKDSDPKKGPKKDGPDQGNNP